MQKYSSILITGGTGSFGKQFIEAILEQHPNFERVIVYSRDELKQYEMAHSPIFSKHASRLRFFIGDVRDAERLKAACENVDVIVHAAALKQVPAAEYNPMECIKTNIFGAENVIKAAIANNCKKVVALSTDKAAAPINLYGATKLCSDKLFVAANNMRGNRDLVFSVVRYGNVMGSRGSVIPFFLEQKKKGVLPITHPDMTRFNITLEQGVELVLKALNIAWGGEIFVPKIPSYRILDVAEAVCPKCSKEIIGIRPGEKLHEEMITEMDALNTVEFEDYFVILPSLPIWKVDEFIDHFKGKKSKFGFSYNSGSNTQWLSVNDLRKLIRQHVDSEFLS